MEEEKVRLQKFMADSGIASRRKSEEYILDGKVKINDIVVKELGIKVNPKVDKIQYLGKTISNNIDKKYILLNKPIGYVTTAKDQFERDSVLDLVNVDTRLVPVGRLDMYTSGALILSNDGDFIYKVTHPKHEIDKTYIATIKGLIKDEDVDKLKKGIEIEIEEEKLYMTKPATIKILRKDEDKDITRVQITIHEGKNRQVRKMFEVLRI